MELTTARERALTIKLLAERGQDAFASRLVMADLVIPLLDLIDAVEMDTMHWPTLAEVIDITGRNPKYFDQRLASLGGRSRLRHWQEQGLAHQAGPGRPWVLHPRLIEESRRGRTEGDGRPPRKREGAVDIRSIVDELTRE